MKLIPLLIVSAQVAAAAGIGWLAARRIRELWLQWQQRNQNHGQR